MRNKYNFTFINEIPGLFRKKRPMCGTCKHRKSGLTTICHKHKRIPPDIQHGGHCEKHETKG